MARKKKVIKCSCHVCSWGMHRGSYGTTKMQNAIRQLRYGIKQHLKQGEFDKALDVIISTGYLD